MSVPRFFLPLVATLLVVAAAGPASATVPGENGRIAFVAGGDIHTMEPDGSAGVNLTNHPATDHSPDWSPDGRFIAFVSDRGGSEAIYVMDADGSDVRRVGAGSSPAWSPDGKRFAFLADECVWVMNADGTGRRRITDPTKDVWRDDYGDVHTGIGDMRPIWSPDGVRIGFTRSYDHSLSTFFAVSPSAGSPLAVRTLYNSYISDWSPDGSRLVGTKSPEGMGGFMEAKILIVDATGDASGVLVPTPAVGAMSDPVWSPDGDRLVSVIYPFASPPSRIMTLDPDGSDASYLTDETLGASEPDWQALNPYPVGLVDPGTGMWHLRGADGEVASFYFGDPGDVPMLGDWDGDGVDTPGLYRRSDGYVYLRNANTQGVADVKFFFGNPDDVPLAGDFDGDGVDTVSLYRPAEGTVYIVDRLGSGDAGLGAADHAYFFGNPGDKPFVGDFDGDGVDTVGLHRESTGLVYFRNDHREGPAEWGFVYGDPGDRVVAYDWDGDGAESVALFRPANAKVYIRFSNTVGVADREYFFGEPDWLPVAGTFETP